MKAEQAVDGAAFLVQQLLYLRDPMGILQEKEHVQVAGGLGVVPRITSEQGDRDAPAFADQAQERYRRR